MKKEEQKMNNIYQIKTSSNGRNVLIIKGFLSIDNIKELNAEDFDVIYVDPPYYSGVYEEVFAKLSRAQ